MEILRLTHLSVTAGVTQSFPRNKNYLAEQEGGFYKLRNKKGRIRPQLYLNEANRKQH